MGTKLNPGRFDCYANAEPDEPMFILLARDRDAAHLVRTWAEIRRARGGHNEEKLAEAEACADAMDAWRAAREHADATTPPGLKKPSELSPCYRCGHPVRFHGIGGCRACGEGECAAFLLPPAKAAAADCELDTDGDGDCPAHPRGCAARPDPLLAWADMLDQRAQEAARGPWRSCCARRECGLVEAHDGPVALTEIGLPGRQLDYQRAGRNRAYIATVDPPIGSALAAIVRALASGESGADELERLRAMVAR